MKRARKSVLIEVYHILEGAMAKVDGVVELENEDYRELTYSEQDSDMGYEIYDRMEDLQDASSYIQDALDALAPHIGK